MELKLVRSWQAAGNIFPADLERALPASKLDQGDDDDRDLAYDDPAAIIRREHKAEKQKRQDYQVGSEHRLEQRRASEKDKQDAEDRRLNEWRKSEDYRHAMQEFSADLADARLATVRARERALADQQRAETALAKARENALLINGERVYFTRDGTRLYGEDDRQITDRVRIAAAQDQHAKQPQATTHEEYIAQRDARDAAATSSAALDQTLSRLDALDKRVKRGDLTPEELAKARLDKQAIIDGLPPDARAEYARLHEARTTAAQDLAYRDTDPAFAAAPDVNAEFRRAGKTASTELAQPDSSSPLPAEENPAIQGGARVLAIGFQPSQGVGDYLKRLNYAAVATAAAFSLLASQASAMTLQEFRKFTTTEQSMYIGAAVNMLAYSYAASGNVAKASCIKNWYFGVKGVETPGPREITIEIGVAGHLDATKYHVEGVILGVTDKACGSGSGN